MGLAIGAAVAVHVAAALAMVMEPPSGAASAGVGGIQISLGPSGGAPGSAADVVSEIDQAEPVKSAAAPQASPEMPPLEGAETVGPPPDAKVAEAAPDAVRASAVPIAVAKAETMVPAERQETAGPVDEVVALARPEPAEAAPPPEPVRVQPIEVPPPVDVAPEPEPAEVAAVVERVDPIDTPPLPLARPASPARADPKPERAHVEQSVASAASVEAPVAETAQAASAQTSGAAGRSGVGQSDQVGSAESSSGGGKPGVSVDYVSVLQAWLEEHKEYPRRARSRRQQGVVWLYFVMDRAGRVLEHRIDRSSGFNLLDEEVREMIRRAQPLPAMPSEMTQARLELVVPVQFQLR